MAGNRISDDEISKIRVNEVLFVQSLGSSRFGPSTCYFMDFGKVLDVSRNPNSFSIGGSIADVSFPKRKIVRAVGSRGEIIIEGNEEMIREWYGLFGEYQSSAVNVSVPKDGIEHCKKTERQYMRENHLMSSYGVRVEDGGDRPLMGRGE